MSIGRLLLRGVVGPLFVGHGTQKLFGWFGGHGLDGTGGFFESLGLRPGRRHATAAGVAETAGGALLAVGALTPVASSVLGATMVTAARKAHAKNGVWATQGGYEYNLVLVGALAALVESGPGSPSVDARLFPRMRGPVWAALTLGAALAGSYIATAEGIGTAPAGAAAHAGDPASGAEGVRESAAEEAATTSA